MATLRLAATELADASAAAFAAKGLDVIRLRPGGDPWRIERSALDPLLTDSLEQDALNKMEDSKHTSIYYRGNTLQVRTCLVHGVRVNNVALGTHCNMSRASSIAPSVANGACAAQWRPRRDSRLAPWW
ncbi:hypothetical protein SPRG_09097 [Saprolegnia parasitica CBS 223.65]|uniref:Uncharacterized protein n=1 Tax=Saprolegnia parasitica (strain CBS 223.65) TaxID=695850 RepID=A0A067C442_SAPPC|nr:hypothetical protein SPRG_09097 [Saprolegnia parasitica CBS 223.65]KDO25268.1 hypothetical protein SPRG_09097 [Saprolegnia parasitica CBS 223.65]|eukprot:XP_012203928.1 hypothetical protein SPRG_09097 [Saprolegnia parasitica CBS 223.65]